MSAPLTRRHHLWAFIGTLDRGCLDHLIEASTSAWRNGHSIYASTRRVCALVRPHRQALQPQLADRAAIDGREVRIDHMRLREARQQPLDRDGDGGAAEDIADAVMRPGAERQDAFRLAMDVEPGRIREHVRIVVRRERGWPHHHALEDAGAADFGVAGADTGKGKKAVPPRP